MADRPPESSRHAPVSGVHARARSINASVRRGLGHASAAASLRASRGVRHSILSTTTTAAATTTPSQHVDLSDASPRTLPSVDIDQTACARDSIAAVDANTSGAAALQPEISTTPRNLRTKSPVEDLREEAAESHTKPKAKSTSSHLRLNFAVIGCPESGKSTFIRNALDLTPQQHAPYKAKLASISGKVYSIRLFEFTFDQVPLQRDGTCFWPQRAQGIPLEHVDGAFILYDPTNGSSLDPLAKYLSSVQSALTPAALVAAKWDLRPLHRRLAPDQIEQSKLLSDRSLALQSSSTRPESAQRCLSALLSAATRTALPSSAALPIRTIRPRRHTTNLRPADSSCKTSTKHSRATSDFPLTSHKPLARPSPARRTTGLRTPPDSSHSIPTEKPNVRIDTSNMLSAAKNSDDDSPKSFLDMDDSPSQLSSDSEGSQQRLDLAASTQTPIDSSVYTFEELVSKLLTAPQSEPDVKFQTSFLTLYRLFAAPSELLLAIQKHFRNIQDPQIFMQSLYTPGRDLTVLHQWLLSYPGDFARNSVFKKMRGFVVPLKEEAEYVTMAKGLLHILATATADDDTDWARSDQEHSRPGTAHTFLSTSSFGSDGQSFQDAEEVPDVTTTRYKPDFSDSDHSLTGPASLTSSQTTMVSDSSMQKQADVLVPRPSHVFSKTHWRMFLQIPDDYIARELTRMDKIMFSLIRPRDLVRHVTLTPDARTQYPGTENVNRMIEHFNHVAYFVTNVIIFRDKPKHRAMALDKVMRVGRELRKLDNYNSLGAVVAGVRGSAVQRLAQTWDLLSEDRRRDFLKLEILMGTNRGHAAYRIAWENSSGPRIPFLPLHRRDLVAAEQGNRTFASPSDADERDAAKKRICWRKFEIMGDVLIDLREAQRTAYPHAPATAQDDVRSLLLGCRIVKDEEKLYERSVQLEPGASAAAAMAGSSTRSEHSSGGGSSGGGIAGIDMSAVRRRLNPFLSRYGIV